MSKYKGHKIKNQITKGNKILNKLQYNWKHRNKLEKMKSYI